MKPSIHLDQDQILRMIDRMNALSKLYCLGMMSNVNMDIYHLTLLDKGHEFRIWLLYLGKI